jgi:hypothetical protein
MTSTHPARTTLFLAPPAVETDDRQAAPRRGEEAMRLLRNPFRAGDPAMTEAEHADALQV